MGITGIICEYNPLHRGHAAHLMGARAQAGNAAVVCVMSGNFVQRGEPAMFHKHARARAAVLSGADLVLELPSPWALASAETFAFGGVALLDSLGVCSHLSFGSECGTVEPLRAAAELLRSGRAEEGIRAALGTGMSYAAARAAAVHSISPEAGDLLQGPNNILGVEYLKALAALNAEIQPVTVRRTGAGHDAGPTGEGPVSASFLRGLIRAGDRSAFAHIPSAARAVFLREVEEGRAPVTLACGEAAVLARLRTLYESDYEALPDATEGLDRRLMRFARTAPTVRAVIEGTKTRRYAESRIRRMLMCAFLGITAEDARSRPPYARVLAFNQTGREVLKRIARTSDFPVITKPAAARSLPEESRALFEKEARATDLYALFYPNTGERAGGGEWTRSPERV